jgi:hypothetical protein
MMRLSELMVVLLAGAVAQINAAAAGEKLCALLLRCQADQLIIVQHTHCHERLQAG